LVLSPLFALFGKKGGLFQTSIHKPKYKRKKDRDKGHCGKRSLFEVEQLCSRRQGRGTVRVDQSFSNSRHSTLKFKEGFQLAGPTERKRPRERGNLQVVQNNLLNGRRESLLAGVSDGGADDKDDNKQRDQTP
jgi:hypothetical protein